MKTQTKILMTFIILPIAFTIFGCKKDYKTITKINPDGSCERTFIVTTGSKNTDVTVLPLPYDSTWQTKWVKDTSSSGDYILTAKKYFDSYTDLCNLYDRNNKPDMMKVNLKIEKKFRWFFTFYKYDEKYNKFNLFNIVPVSEFLTQKEIDDYTTGRSDSTIEAKVKKWEERNYLEDFVDAIIKAAVKLNDPSLTEKMINDKKEVLFKMLADSKGDSDSLTSELNSIFNTKVFFKLKDVIRNENNSITKRAERMFDAEGNYTNSVLMPGIIIKTNADRIEGNKVAWDFTSKRFTIKDFEMKAESRIMNLWAVYTSALILILIIAALLIPVVKQKKNIGL